MVLDDQTGGTNYELPQDLLDFFWGKIFEFAIRSGRMSISYISFPLPLECDRAQAEVDIVVGLDYVTYHRTRVA